MAEAARRKVSRSARVADRVVGLVLGIGGSFAPFALASTMIWLLFQADLTAAGGDWGRVLGWMRGSATLGMVALVAATPLAITGALLGRSSEFVRMHLRVASAVPLAVPAFLLLHWTAPWMSKTYGVPAQHPAWASAALALGMIAPLWLILSDALDRGFEISSGAYALGATSAQVLRTLVLPSSLSGLVAALLRGVSRAMGETMVVLLISGNFASGWGGASGAASVGAALVLDLPEARPGGILWTDLMRGGLLLSGLTVFVYALSDGIDRHARSTSGPG